MTDGSVAWAWKNAAPRPQRCRDMTKRGAAAAAGDMAKRGMSQPRYSIKQKTAQTESLGFPFSIFYTNESVFFCKKGTIFLQSRATIG